MSNINVCFYHKDCNDGLVSAYNVWEKNKNNTLCIPINYHEFKDQTPDEFMEMCFSDKVVQASLFSSFKGSVSFLLKESKTSVKAFLVDISVPKHILLRISEMFKEVLVLDHHVSANEIYENDPDFVSTANHSEIKGYLFNKNVRIFMDSVNSGAYLTWCVMNPLAKEVPEYIKLVSQYDTWNKPNKDPDYFAAGLRASNPRSFKGLTHVLEFFLKTMEVGKIIDVDRENRTKAAISRRTVIDVHYQGNVYKAAIVNSNMDISSLIGNNLVNDHGVDIGMSYIITTDKKVGWSIRSKAPFSCLFVAKHFNGGGHEQACGFSTDLQYLVNLLSEGVMRIE